MPIQSDRDQFPAQVDRDQFPPQPDRDQFPKRPDRDQFPQQSDRDQFPQQPDRGQFSSQSDRGQFPPPPDRGQFLQQSSQDQLPPQPDRDQFPQQPNRDQFIPPTDRDQFPQNSDRGQFPPQPDRNQFPRANLLAQSIPREQLTLAEPEQSLNAWQFYYPPGPPPATQQDDADYFDTAGSDALPATANRPLLVDSEGSTDSQTVPAVSIPGNLGQSSSVAASSDNRKQQIISNGLLANVDRSAPVAIPTRVDQPANAAALPDNLVQSFSVSASLGTSQGNQQDTEKKITVSTEKSLLDTVASSASVNEKVLPDSVTVITPVKSGNLADKEKPESAENNKQITPSLPPNFNPKFEEGGWTPIDVFSHAK